MIGQLLDKTMEMIILYELLYLVGSFNLISQSQVMVKDIKVKSVNYYCLDFYSHYGKLIATAPHINGLFFLD